MTRQSPDRDAPSPKARLTVRWHGQVMCVGFVRNEFCDHRMDLTEIPQIQTELEKLLQNTDPPNVVLDLAGFEYLPTTGLGMIVAIHSKLVKMGGALRVACPNPSVREVFFLTRLDRVFGIHETLDDATAAFA